MKVLVVGSGGREHAMAWKLAQSPKVQQVYVAPGNGGTAQDKQLVNVPITDGAVLRQWALDNGIGLTLVGPEAPLAAGMVDDFRAHGLRIFGPTQAAAQLESSKAFSKAFMQRHGIPTAEFETFTDAALANHRRRACAGGGISKEQRHIFGAHFLTVEAIGRALFALNAARDFNQIGIVESRRRRAIRIVENECDFSCVAGRAIAGP
jgi:phosphoribosylamine--glycine ligase